MMTAAAVPAVVAMMMMKTKTKTKTLAPIVLASQAEVPDGL